MEIQVKISQKVARTAAEKQRSEFFRLAVQLMKENQHTLVFEEAGKQLIENPDDDEMWNLLGVAAHFAHSVQDAEMAFSRAISLNPDYREAWTNLATTQAKQHRLAEALKAYIQALNLKPDAALHSSILFLQQKLEPNPKKLFLFHQEFGKYYGKKKPYTFKNQLSTSRPLRIGYVSGDFREHSVAYFIEPVLAHHNHDEFIIHAFSNSAEDYVTERLKSHCSHWHDVRKLDDNAMLNLVRSLKIDILIDLSGHTALNRLPVFGMRAAPVQASWFGYMGTTGLSEMDYRLTEPSLIPPTKQAYYTEELYYLESNGVWAPPPEARPLSPSPHLSNGHITFGSLNNFDKVSDQVLATWAEIMAKIPNAVLVIVAQGAQDPSLQQRVLPIFEAVGAAERLVFIERRPFSQFFELFEHIDICLDQFPYNGGTTTLHTFWAGIPVVTLAGEDEIQRAGKLLLQRVGLDDLAAPSREEYVRTACELAQSSEYLVKLRSELRDRLKASPLMNFHTTVKGLEDAYRDMFSRYCQKQLKSRST